MTPLGVIVLVVLVDLLGFTLVMPLLAPFADQYGFKDWQIGFLFSAYPVCQLVAGPILGRLERPLRPQADPDLQPGGHGALVRDPRALSRFHGDAAGANARWCLRREYPGRPGLCRRRHQARAPRTRHGLDRNGVRSRLRARPDARRPAAWTRRIHGPVAAPDALPGSSGLLDPRLVARPLPASRVAASTKPPPRSRLAR